MSWRYVSAIAVGTSHVRSDTGCQDRCAGTVVACPDGAEVFVGVVSDGAGSAAFAERGAALVCERLPVLVRDALASSSDLDAVSDDDVRTWFLLLRDELRAQAGDTDAELREFSATVLLAVASDHQTLCASVGDGAVVVRAGAAAPFEVALWPEGGEYANQTYFLTDDAVAERVAIRRFDGVSDVIAFSDGLQQLALERSSKTAFEPFFAPLVRTVRESPIPPEELARSLAAYLDSDAVNRRTDDDKALVVGCRTETAA
jgi:hypothetical protein